MEIKSDIASDISKTMTDYVINGRLVQMPGFMDQIDYTKSTIEWEISKSVIKSRIQSYFNNLQLIKTWENLTFYLTEFVSLETGLSKKNTDFDNKLCIRIKHVMNMYEYLISKNESFANQNPLNINLTEYNNCKYIYDKQYSDKYFREGKGDINWNILIHKESLNNLRTQQEYLTSWLLLERIFDKEKNELIILILKTPIFVL